MSTKYTEDQVKEMARRVLSGKAVGQSNAVQFSEMLQDEVSRKIYNNECKVIEKERAEKNGKHLLVKWDARYGATVSFENFPMRKALKFGENKLDMLTALYAEGHVMGQVKDLMVKANGTETEYKIDVEEFFPATE